MLCVSLSLAIIGWIQVSPCWAHQFIVPHVITAVTAKFQMIAPKKENLNSTVITLFSKQFLDLFYFNHMYYTFWEDFCIVDDHILRMKISYEIS